MEMVNASCSVESIYSGLGAVTAGGLWRGRQCVCVMSEDVSYSLVGICLAHSMGYVACTCTCIYIVVHVHVHVYIVVHVHVHVARLTPEVCLLQCPLET